MGGGGYGSGGKSRSIRLRVKIGVQKGDAPFSSEAQNKQVRDVAVALGGLTKAQKRELYDAITGMGYGYHEIIKLIKDMFGK